MRGTSSLHAQLLCFVAPTAAAVESAASGAAPKRVATGSSDWYMGYEHTDSQAGISWYTHMWQLWPAGVPAGWGIGLPATWLHGSGISFAQACACNPHGWPNDPKVAPGDPSNHCCDIVGSADGARHPEHVNRSRCGFLYETIEVGPQDDVRWRTGANVGCFAYTAGAGLFDYGGNAHPCDQIALVALSNQMLLQPNGASFAKDGMLGVGYVRTPLGKTNASDHRNFWTLVFDTETFSGPLGYYLPEFFAGRAKGWEKESAVLKDLGSPGIGLNNDQFAMEWNHGYTYQQNSTTGDLFYKLPPLSFPFDGDELVLAMGNQVHSDDEVEAPLEEALSTGRLDASKIMAGGRRANCIAQSGNATFHIDGSRATGQSVAIGRMATSIENETCVWKLTGRGSFLQFPHYFDKDLNPVNESQVPAPLASQQFALDPNILTREFNGVGKAAQGCYNEPGPADPKLYCVQSKVNQYWVGYRWYMFVDQPAMQRAALNEGQRAFMQRRVEALHGMVGRVSRWIKPGSAPAGSDLAHVDPVALVTPPAGLERGYVPVVMFEGDRKPAQCVEP